MLTFLVKGMRPRAWWRAAHAKRNVRTGAIIWLTLLALLTALIVISARIEG